MDRNDNGNAVAVSDLESLSARRAWIEINLSDIDDKFGGLSLSARRAWIEISKAETAKTSNAVSLSARRAWIEIAIANTVIFCFTVALRKESVDRNNALLNRFVSNLKSLSARRAWIEMTQCRL